MWTSALPAADGGSSPTRRRALRATLIILVAALALFLILPDVTFDTSYSSVARAFCRDEPVNRFARPEQVHISLGSDETEVIVMWVTSMNVSSYVRYGTESYELGCDALGGPTTSYQFFNYTSGSIHTVVLTGLQPSTTYYYKCGSPSGWSALFSFVTAPRVGTHGVVVGTVGDMGTTQASVRLLDNTRDKNLDMFWHVGDLSYADGKQPKWDIYGGILENLAANMIYMPLAGNHENSNKKHTFTPFSLRYNMPLMVSYSRGSPEAFYYSFKFGSIHFICLDSEHNTDSLSEQHRWLSAELRKVNRQLTPWLVVGWHRPWYNSNTVHYGEGDLMKEAMEDLLYQHKVDLCVTGHVHAYERSHPVYKNVPTPDGPVHITIGTGGTPEGLVTNWIGYPSWSAVRLARDWGFGRFYAINETHAEWNFYHNNEDIPGDYFMLVRDRSNLSVSETPSS